MGGGEGVISQVGSNTHASYDSWNNITFTVGRLKSVNTCYTNFELLSGVYEITCWGSHFMDINFLRICLDINLSTAFKYCEIDFLNFWSVTL